jgi:hypothetical protein
MPRWGGLLVLILGLALVSIPGAVNAQGLAKSVQKNQQPPPPAAGTKGEPALVDDGSDERYRVVGDGTVVDLQERLMWAQNDNQGDLDWNAAREYSALGPPEILGKFKDWRLPAIRELAGLFQWAQTRETVESDCGRMVRTPKAFHLTCDWVWTSESKGALALAFHFGKGYVLEEKKNQRSGFRTLTVRTMSPEEPLPLPPTAGTEEKPSAGSPVPGRPGSTKKPQKTGR